MSTELTERPSELFAGDPRRVLAAAREIAGELGDVLRERRLVLSIRGNEHVLIEGWTLLGSMVGVFADVEWSRPVFGDAGAGVGAGYGDAGAEESRSIIGWEARASSRAIDGRLISSAEAMCTRNERSGQWRYADEYAIRSMAQTRAISKALRLPLGFIVELAGYKATPAEETPPPERPTLAGRQRETVNGLRRAIGDAALERGMTSDQLAELATAAGVSGGRATVAQLRAILEQVKAFEPDADLPDIKEEVTDSDDSGREAEDGADEPTS